MKFLLPLFALIAGAGAAHAQALQIDHIDVTQYGIYTATTTSKLAAPGTASGTASIVGNISLAEMTRTIPLRLGVRFGFNYTVVGTPAGAPVSLHFVTIYPPPGLTNPATHQLMAQGEVDHDVSIGETTYKGYHIGEEWGLVPGAWIMQIWYQGRKLAEQSFTLVKQ